MWVTGAEAAQAALLIVHTCLPRLGCYCKAFCASVCQQAAMAAAQPCPVTGPGHGSVAHAVGQGH